MTSGSGLTQTALLVIKPIEAGLDTDLVVPTDRRTYVVRLVSDATSLHFRRRVSLSRRRSREMVRVSGTTRCCRT